MISPKTMLTLGLLLFVNLPTGFASENLVAGHTAEQALQLGERIYREGVLPSGEPMRAFVQGDIPVDGAMFSCQSCHLRSGLGTAEGTIITLPTNGGKLFKPLHHGAEVDITPSRAQLPSPFQSDDIRPAYTEEKLREAIWAGLDPGGRELSWNMPRYELSPGDMDILVHYLKNLSVVYSPGVDEQTLTFATVITDDVNQTDRQAILGTLKAYINDRNAQNRHEEQRSKQGPFYKQDRYTAYRRIELLVWDLRGPATTWTAQLEAFFREKPVFALLGGMSNQSWEPIHRFCEKKRLPCLLPQTPFPVIDESSWYTLYFSKGYYQEGEAAAHFLRKTGENAQPKVVQLVRSHPESTALSSGFAETWQRLGYPAPPSEMVDKAEPLAREDWRKLADKHPGAILLAWLPLEDLIHADLNAEAEAHRPRLIFSSTLIQDKLNRIPESLRKISLATYPTRLPDDIQPRMRFIKKWLDVHKLPETNFAIQAKAYFLNWMLTGALRMMGNDFYRDYFLDIIDMMNDETYAIVNYPRVSFGPGQRYASKGCYLVEIGSGSDPKLTLSTPWVIH